MSDHVRVRRTPPDPPMISYWQYVALVRRWDRDSLIRGAGWASANNKGQVIVNGQASQWLPWNVAGMAVTAICRGTANGPSPNPEELRELVWQFGNTDEGPRGQDDAVLRFMERLFHEQMPYQRRSLHEWSRGHALLVDTPFPAHRQAEVMVSGWVEDLLGGVSVAEYSATGFMMWASAASSNGRFDPQSWDAELDGLRAILPRERFGEIARAHFVTTIDGVKDARRAVPSLDRSSEKYAYNPLLAHPFLSDVDPIAWIAPSTDLVEQKVGVAGITYLGIDRWGTKFTRDLGHLFEAYVGRNLALIDGATVIGEIDFGTRRTPNMSADWIVVTDKLVILIEVKASSPTESIRQSVGELFSGVRSKLSDAIGQLNKTAAAIGTAREAFAEIPRDRPVVGLVVTLGNFPSAVLAYRMGQLQKSEIPIAFVAVGELEELVPRSADEIAELLLEGFAESDVPDLIENMNGVVNNYPRNRNPIIDAAWLANPIMSYIETKSRTPPVTDSEQ